MSSDKVRAIASQASSPGEWMPSSLVMRIRMSFTGRYLLCHGRACPGHPDHKAKRYPPKRDRRDKPGDDSKIPCGKSFHFFDLLQPAHVGRERVRHRDRAVFLLVG